MRNDIGPHYFKLYYRSGGHDHTMQFSVQDGTYPDGSGYTDSVALKNASNSTNSVAMNNLVTVLKPMLPTTGSWVRWERYFKATVNSNSLLTDSGTFTSGAGTSTFPSVKNVQTHFSFQGVGGNRYGMVILEGPDDPNAVSSYSDLPSGGRERNLIDYLLGDNSIITTRGGDYLNTFQRMLNKTNDTLRKRNSL
jgi:hypothetical protein